MRDMREFDFLNTPIVDIVNEIIIDSAKRNASDIHFDPMENYLKIRIRIDGNLIDYAIIENKYKRNLITRVKLLAGMNITESRLPQDGAIKTTIEDLDLDMRVSALPTSFGEKIVIRILDYSMSLQGLETLGFTNENYELILKMIANPNGIILVTGATGSGKSTTVYSILQRLNREETNIITVEDPVEMNIEGINQVQVNPEIGLDFANVLRSILRQDPNIILIGEIRDSETAKIAVRASITGHLVLSTLHTNNSLTTIERLIDMDVERYLIASSLKGIISQTLARKLCKKCAKKRPTTETEKQIFKKALNMEVNEVYEPGKCDECTKGYKGRIALQEVLLINEEIRDAINKNEDRHTLRKLIYQKNIKTLLQDGLLKIINGTTTFEEVFRLVDLDDDVDDIFSSKANELNDIINDAPENVEITMESEKQKIEEPKENKNQVQPKDTVENNTIISIPTGDTTNNKNKINTANETIPDINNTISESESVNNNVNKEKSIINNSVNTNVNDNLFNNLRTEESITLKNVNTTPEEPRTIKTVEQNNEINTIKETPLNETVVNNEPIVNYTPNTTTTINSTPPLDTPNTAPISEPTPINNTIEDNTIPNNNIDIGQTSVLNPTQTNQTLNNTTLNNQSSIEQQTKDETQKRPSNYTDELINLINQDKDIF